MKVDRDDPPSETLLEGRDYTFEGGLMVLTAEYLLERGFCCGNKCRNCPYDWINVPET